MIVLDFMTKEGVADTFMEARWGVCGQQNNFLIGCRNFCCFAKVVAEKLRDISYPTVTCFFSFVSDSSRVYVANSFM